MNSNLPDVVTEPASVPPPKISRGPRVSLVWVVPLVAVGVASWLMYREWRSRGPEVTVDFADGSGVEAGKTVLEYKGVSIGMVRDVELKKDLSGVRLRLRLERNAAAIARTGAQFWIVHPEIGFGGIRGLETLVSGVRMNVRPGEGPPAYQFRGLDKPPTVENLTEGRAFILESDHLGAVAPHTPVNYRDVKVGEVEMSRLSDDSESVLIRIRVQTPYVDLIRTNTQFWAAGGVPVRISLFGGEMRNLSLQSLATGTVGFATPDEPGPPAADGAVFKMNNEPEKEWLKWHPKIAIKPPPNEAPAAQPRRPGLPELLEH